VGRGHVAARGRRADAGMGAEVVPEVVPEVGIIMKRQMAQAP
jgi:hypothetical protein